MPPTLFLWAVTTLLPSRRSIKIMMMIIIITVVVSVARYLIDKDGLIALYKITQTYKYTRRPKIYIYILYS